MSASSRCYLARAKRTGGFASDFRPPPHPWELAWDRPDPPDRGGARAQWYLYRDPIDSMGTWPIVWVWSKRLTGHHHASRQRRIGAAIEALGEGRGENAPENSAAGQMQGRRRIELVGTTVAAAHHQ